MVNSQQLSANAQYDVDEVRSDSSTNEMTF